MLPKLSIVDFSYLDKTKLLEILALRNSDYVREKMASSEEILEDTHLLFCESLKQRTDVLFCGVYLENKLVGVIVFFGFLSAFFILTRIVAFFFPAIAVILQLPTFLAVILAFFTDIFFTLAIFLLDVLHFTTLFAFTILIAPTFMSIFVFDKVSFVAASVFCTGEIADKSNDNIKIGVTIFFIFLILLVQDFFYNKRQDEIRNRRYQIFIRRSFPTATTSVGVSRSVAI